MLFLSYNLLTQNNASECHWRASEIPSSFPVGVAAETFVARTLTALQPAKGLPDIRPPIFARKSNLLTSDIIVDCKVIYGLCLISEYVKKREGMSIEIYLQGQRWIIADN